MRGKEMLEAVGYVEPALIEKGEKKKRLDWKRWTAIAACACLVLGGALIYRHSLPQYATEILSMSDTQMGMGYEGYQVYDISEIRRDNPTEEVKFKALNAYRNTISYDERLYPCGQDLDAMEAYLLVLAEKFGLDTSSLEIMDNTPSEGQLQGLIMEFGSRGLEVPKYYTLPTRLWIRTDEIEIAVEHNMTTTITFTEGISVPDGYHFAYNSTPEELTAVGEYLWNEYGDIIGYENAKLFLNGGNYSKDGEQKYTLTFYDGTKDKTKNFENYIFNYTEFSPNSEGKMWMIRIFSDKAYEKIGLYPIISEEEAMQLLLDGQYYTSVTEEFPGESAVERCEIVYRTGGYDKILMPFYRFYVYLENAPGMHLYPEGMKTYGAYYVPAVDPDYLEK